MKKIIIIALTLISARSFGQAAKSFCLAPSCKQTINAGDTATLFAQLTTSDLTPGTFIWKQTGGPGISFTAKTTGAGGTAQSLVGLRPASNGVYVFTITGTSAGGIVASVADTLQVNTVARRIQYVMTVYSDSSRVINQ